MIVLNWSDQHRRTPVDVFVYEPFDFAREYTRANREMIFQDISAPSSTALRIPWSREI